MSDLAAGCEPVHAATRCPASGWPHSDRMVRAARVEKIMIKRDFEASSHELTENELKLVSGGVAAPNATALNAGAPDATTDMRKSSGGQHSGAFFLVFTFKLVAV